MKRTDFSEVAHTGGKATFHIECDEEGQTRYQVEYSHSSPLPMTLAGIYAHPDGFACGNVVIGGIGQPFNPPPLANCVVVLMASDSHGNFGHECPACKKHFRTGNIPSRFPLTCPYCGLRAESYHFLTPPQKGYIRHYLETLKQEVSKMFPGSSKDVVIDMDIVADSVTDKPRSDFYYTSIIQQTEFWCPACNSYNDIRGRYGYCAFCGWRNTANTQKEALEKIREQANDKTLSPSDAVKKAVSEFDSAAKDFKDQLIARVPMKESRINQLKPLLFHDIDKFDGLMKKCFDIDLMKDLRSQRNFVCMMFHRRHVYEHNGGVADSRYKEKSGDPEVREGELIRETIENMHKFIGCLNKMVETFEIDFHEIFKPEPFCIDIENERKARTRKKII